MSKRLVSISMLLMLLISTLPIAVQIIPTIANPSPSETREVSQPVQLTTHTNHDRNPSFFRASDGIYWLFFVHGRGPEMRPFWDVHYTTSTDNGTTWSTPTNVSASVSSTGQRGMAAFQDDTGNIWVFVSASKDGGVDSNLHYYTFNGTTWTGPTDVPGPISGSHVDALQTADGKIWVFYESAGVKAINYNGTSWSSVITVSATGGIPKAIEADGKLHAAWCDGTTGKIYYSNSTDGVTWSVPQVVVDVVGKYNNDPVISVDSNGTYWLFYAPWTGRGGGLPDSQWIEVVYSSDDGATWSSRINVTGGGCGNVYWDDMWPEPYLDSNGKMLLFYTSERNANGTSRIDRNIWMFDIVWDLRNNHYEFIQTAIDAANSGDTIIVHDGTYYENIVVNKPLTITSASLPIIDGGAAGDCITVSANNVVVNGFEIRNGYNGIMGETDGSTFSNNIIHDNLNIPGSSGVGILLWGDNDNNIITGNTIYDNDRQGIFIGYSDDSKISTGNVISYNTIYNNGLYRYANGPDASEYGIQLWTADNNIIEHNEIYDHDDWFPYGGTFDFAQGIYLCDSNNNFVTHNDLHNNNYAVGLWHPSRPVVTNYINYNDIWGNTGYGVRTFDGPPLVDARFNWWGHASGPTHSSNPGGTGDKISSNVDYSPWLGFVVGTSPMTWHVNPTGAPGAIQEAVDEASPGDTIIVHNGTYSGAIVSKNVTIIGGLGGASIITSGVPYKVGSSLYTAFRLDATADGAEVRNFTINCNAIASFYFAIFSRNADNVIVDSLTVNDAVQGITNWGGSNWEITNNVLNNTEAAGGGGIAIFLGATPPSYPVCSGNLIQNNTITASATAPDYTCPGIGLCLDLRYGAYNYLTGSEDISNNQILNNNITAPGALNGVGIEMGVIGLEGNTTKIAATLGLIHDNTIQGNTLDGADMGVYFYTVANLTIQQNEIKNCNEGIHIEDGSIGNTISNNNIFGNTIGINMSACAQVYNNTIEGGRTGIWLGPGPYSTSTTVKWNTIIDFVKAGIVSRDVKDILIEGNNISTTIHDEAPNGIDIGTYSGTTGTVTGNEISGCSWNGFTGDYDTSWSGSGILVIESGDSLEILGNIVHDCDVGMDIESDSMNITCNEVHNNIYGFVFWNAKPKVNYNNIYNNTQYGVYRTAMGDLTGVLDARYNWWGNSSGPTHLSNPGGTGDTVSDNVSFSPWLLQVKVPPLVHDIAIISVVPSVAHQYPGRMVNITVVVKNNGNMYETFNVTAYRDSIPIGTMLITDLGIGENTTLIFNWNTSGLPPCHNWTIRAEAPLVGDIYPSDNNVTDGTVKIKMIGDVNADGTIDIYDIVATGLAFGATPSDTNWNPQAELVEDGIIDIFDLVTIAMVFGNTCP